ncbi:sigma-70 family RNA polymerase sigma factor [Aquihabitans sp. McL0605]|uniref:sigma-70 family RNA polymerase sigma factor n=1 Tax=Aquihabitans sp. McL0605 TaxID=3415671 RepID=UPI003CF8D470
MRTGTARTRSLRLRPGPRGVALAVSEIDLRRAGRTIPRGRSAADADQTPGVKPSLWLEHVQYAAHHDDRVLARLVEEYDDYAISMARRFYRDWASNDDLDQIAREALIRALRRFDPDRGLPFAALATPTVVGALRRHVRDHGWLIRVPRHVHEFAVVQRATSDRLASELGRFPTRRELAAELDMADEDVLGALEAIHARNLISIESEGGDGRPVKDHLDAEDRSFLLAEDQMVVAAALSTLDEPGRDLVRLYFYDEWSQSQIARHLGVSQMQVSRLLSAVLRHLRNRFDAS